MASASNQFDAIVVGAGPAGSMAAWRLAKQGRKVALLERGAYPGAKNLFGGMVYSLELAKHFPGFEQHAPIERPVTRHSTYVLSEGRSVNFDLQSDAFGEAPYNGFTAFRSRFDTWLAEQAVAAGALLVPSTTVDDLLYENGRVVGVRTRREAGDLHAPVVILADGILSLLGKKAGLIKEQPKEHYSLGVREVLALPAGTIEDRFQVDAGGGCAALFLGEWPKSLQGGGFVYTNRESLSVGFVAQLPSLESQGLNIADALEAFKRHPTVRRMIQGAERLEYGAHIVPEGGYHMRPQLVGDGVMLTGDAAGLVLAAGVIYEGVHYAMHSGVLAADAAHEALEQGDVSAEGLAPYAKRLNASYVTRNLKAFQHMPSVLTNPRMYSLYPAATGKLLEDLFRADEAGHQKLLPLAKRHILRHGLLAAVKDLWHIARALLF